MIATSHEFFVLGGTVPRDAPSYVTRRADAELLDALRRGEFCYVLTARQMGKSSLMVRAAAALRHEGIACAVLDLTAVGVNVTEEQWYDGLLNLLGYQLDLQDEMDDFWRAHRHIGPMQRMLAAIEKVVLARVRGRLALFVDEIDAVRSLPFSADEFFAGVRACYNRRVDEPEFSRLTFCLLGVATPAGLIHNPRTTPFNIGRRIDLADFTAAECASLASGFDLPADTAGRLLQRVLAWTNGHPYLTQRLCASVAADPLSRSEADVDRICSQVFLSPESLSRDDNLMFVRDRMLRSEEDIPELLSLYGRVVAGRAVPDDPGSNLVSTLRLAGIVRTEAGRLQVRNRIYAQVFDRGWIGRSLPDAEARRQRAAYRRGLFRSAAVGGFVVLAIASLAVQSVLLARRAERGEAAAREARRRAERGERAARESADRAERLARERTHSLAIVSQQSRRAQAAELQERLARTAADMSAAEERRAADRERAAAKRERRATVAAMAARQAEKAQRSIAERESAQARQQAYMSGINLAWRELDRPNIEPEIEVSRLRGALDSLKPSAGQPDLRGFDWWYLNKIVHRDIVSWHAHKGIVRVVALSPDGSLLASAGDDGTVHLWDTARRRPLPGMPRSPFRVLAIAFSPDGKWMSMGGSDYRVTLWNVRTRRRRLMLAGHTEDVNCVDFSPDGRLLASASDDKTVRLWSVQDGKEIAVLDAGPDWISSVRFIDKGASVVTGGRDGVIRTWNVATHRMTRSFDMKSELQAQFGAIRSLAVDPICSELYIALENHIAIRWQLPIPPDGPAGVVRMQGHTDVMLAVAGSNGMDITASADRTARLWQHGTGVAELRGFTWGLHSAAISRDGRVAALGDDRGFVYLWDLARSHEDRWLDTRPGSSALDSGFLPGGVPVTLRMRGTEPLGLFEFSLAGTDGKTIVRATEPVGQERGAWSISGQVSSGRLSPDGRQAALIYGGRRSLHLWDVAEKRFRTLRLPHDPALRCVEYSADGKLLAAGDENGQVWVWNMASGSRLRLGARIDVDMLAVAISPDGRLAAGVDGLGAARVWDLSSGSLIASVPGNGTPAHACAFSPDARTFAFARDDDTIRVWPFRTGTPRRIRAMHGGPIWSLAYCPDGRDIVSVGADGYARLWSTLSLEEVGVLPIAMPPTPFNSGAPEHSFCSSRFSPDGRRLIVVAAPFAKLFDAR